jgi:regulator of cell morphogenesis and NO signaling
MKFNGSEKLGDIVAAFPEGAEIFKKYQIDFCCGGQRKLADVIATQHLDLTLVVSELNENVDRAKRQRREGQEGIDLRTAPLAMVLKHIIDNHHIFLRREMPQISELLEKIVKVHGGTHTELEHVKSIFSKLEAELTEHLNKEEESLFPLIASYESKPSEKALEEIDKLIKEIEREHDQAGDQIKALRSLTQDYRLPETACASYKLTYDKLEKMEDDLFRHIHIENNILQPRIELEINKVSTARRMRSNS